MAPTIKCSHRRPSRPVPVTSPGPPVGGVQSESNPQPNPKMSSFYLIHKATGRYFDGINFSAATLAEARAFSDAPDIRAVRLIWGGLVSVVEIA